MTHEDREGDFRTTATVGIGLAALTLLLPFAIVNFLMQAYTLSAGALGITAMLMIGVGQVRRGRDYQKLTLYGFVPAGTLFVLHVFGIDGVVATVWCYPTIIAFYCILDRRRAMAANAFLLAVVMPMTFVTLEPALAARFCATLIATSLFSNILVREIDAMRGRLRFQIEHDPLTGVLNRSSLGTRLDAAIAASREGAVPAPALLALDLDHFKLINDRFGHETGDRVLREVARLLRAATGDGTAIFRTGGEEFLVLVEGRSTADAEAIAETLRATIEREGILQHHPVTASVGVATLRKTDDRTSWMIRGDERLYAAKGGGRNRVVLASGPSAPAPSAPTASDEKRPTAVGL